MAFGIMIFSPLKSMPSLNTVISVFGMTNTANIELGPLICDLASLSELFELTAVNQSQIESLIGVHPV